jgi:hypothetical protein
VTPGALQPAFELLGDMLLDTDQPDAALAAYRQSLEKWPRRFNSLLGAARAADLAGKRKVAREYYDKRSSRILRQAHRACRGEHCSPGNRRSQGLHRRPLTREPPLCANARRRVQHQRPGLFRDRAFASK